MLLNCHPHLPFSFEAAGAKGHSQNEHFCIMRNCHPLLTLSFEAVGAKRHSQNEHVRMVSNYHPVLLFRLRQLELKVAPTMSILGCS